jgi:replicative DNA helicase
MHSGAPQTKEIERALLAHILADNAVLDALPGLEGHDFAHPMHRELFETMCDLRREGRAINVVTLGALTGSDPLGGASPLETLRTVQFGENLPAPEHLADAVLDASIRRAIAAQGEWLAGQVANLRVKPADMLSMQLREFDSLIARVRGRRKTRFSFAEGMDEALEEWQSPETGDLISTGLKDLDRAIGGLRRGNLIILAGRTSMGKSACAANLASNAAKAGHGVLIFSMEMKRREWLARVASEATWVNGHGVPYSEAEKKRLSKADLERFMRGGKERRNLPSEIDDATDLTVSEIAARTRRAAADFARQGKELGLVVVDHIGKATKNYAGRRDLEVGEITHGLATIAKTENVAMLALCQLNRGVEDRTNKRPQLADLRDSGRIEEDADVVLLAYREAYYLDREKCEAGSAEEAFRLKQLAEKKNTVEIGIAKCRNGEIGPVELFCDMSCNVIRDLDRRNR